MGQLKREILCIDDDVQSLKVRTIALEAYGYEVWAESDPRNALRVLSEHDIDAVVMDFQMPGMNGAEAATEMKRQRPHVPVMILSALPWLPDCAASLAVDVFVQKGEPLAVFVHRLEEMIASGDRQAAVSPGAADSVGIAIGGFLGHVAAKLRPLKKAAAHKRAEGPLPALPRQSTETLRTQRFHPNPQRRYK